MADTRSFSVKLDEDSHAHLGQLLDAVAARDGVGKGEALASMIPAMERAAAVDKAPALGQYLAAIDQAQAVVYAQVNAIAALYAGVEDAEKAKAQATTDALAATVADLRAQLSDAGTRLDEAAQLLAVAKSEAAEARAGRDAAQDEAERLRVELAAERAKGDVLAAIAAKVDALTAPSGAHEK